MGIHGHIQNGVVVLEGDVSLPEGTAVTIVVRATAEANDIEDTDQRRDRLINSFQKIASLPMEGATDPFSAADHDKVLYGKP